MKTREALYNSLSKALFLQSTTLKHLHKVHSLIITSGLYKTSFFSGKLISKYSHLKNPQASISVFSQISTSNNVYLYNSIIRALTQNGLFSEALDFYSKMRVSELEPDKYTFPSVINACAGFGSLEMGILVHDRVLDMGFVSDLYIGNALIYMYARLGDLERAGKVFDEMRVRDVVSWNSLISGYSSNEYWEEAIDVYRQSRVVGIVPDSYTLLGVLHSCGSLVEIDEGKIVHALTEKIGNRSDVILSNGLLSMYFKFEKLEESKRLFHEMVVKDTVTWNTMIWGCCQLGLFRKAIDLFKEMVCSFEPDLLTITSILRVCGQIGDLEFGRYVHDYMKRNAYECDTTASNILIYMYAKCGDLQASREAFDSTKCKDMVSWNSLISGFVQNGFYEEATKLLNSMKMDIRPDSVTYTILLSLCSHVMNIELGKGLHCEIVKVGVNSRLVVGNTLIDMYSKCSKVEDSVNQFENMRIRDIVTWNSVISASVHSEDCNLGFKFLGTMRTNGISPDTATLLAILSICSKHTAKRQGKEIHMFILKFGFESDVPIGNALIDMYSKCGLLRNSILVFKHMERRDIVTYTSLITAYGMFGDGREAIAAFNKMEAAYFTPDHIAFVAILYACSHSGLVNEGRNYFERMKNDYNIEPDIEHYACMVDLLSRSGLVLEAEEFIKSMPIKPDASIWGALLSGCRASGNIKLAERASERVIESKPDDIGYYVLASNVYAALGQWDRVGMIRRSLIARGYKKDPGRSWA